MRMVKLGKTGIEVSCVGVGGWPLHFAADQHNNYNFASACPGKINLVEGPGNKTHVVEGHGEFRTVVRWFPLGNTLALKGGIQVLSGTWQGEQQNDPTTPVMRPQNILYFPEFWARSEGVDEAMAIAAIRRASEIGINLVEADGGNEQPGGRSEEIVGAAVQGCRKQWVIASKSHKRDRQGFEQDLQVSLATLKTEYVDIYQIHQLDDPDAFDDVMSAGGAFAALADAKSKGLVRAIGLTSHNEECKWRRKGEAVMAAA